MLQLLTLRITFRQLAEWKTVSSQDSRLDITIQFSLLYRIRCQKLDLLSTKSGNFTILGTCLSSVRRMEQEQELQETGENILILRD